MAGVAGAQGRRWPNDGSCEGSQGAERAGVGGEKTAVKMGYWAWAAVKTRTRDPDPHQKCSHGRRDCWQPGVRRKPGLLAVGSPDIRQDFRRRETENLSNQNSLGYVGQKYDGHTNVFTGD
jgi:hypothetical protein